jgi:hypothetical protein
VINLRALVFLVLVACCGQTTQLYVIEHVDYTNKIYHVRLHESLVTGADGACHIAGIVINFILEKNPEWKVYVLNSWVPSKHNPINLKWSRRLAEGY